MLKAQKKSHTKTANSQKVYSLRMQQKATEKKKSIITDEKIVTDLSFVRIL